MTFLDLINDNYLTLVDLLSPFGRLIFIPYVLFRLVLQCAYFRLINFISLVHVFILYNYNLLFAINESNEDNLTFTETYNQKVHYNKYRSFDQSRPLTKNAHFMFAVPVGFQEFFNMVWWRTDYYYTRIAKHAPFCIFSLLTFRVPKEFVYDPDEHILQSAANHGKTDFDLKEFDYGNELNPAASSTINIDVDNGRKDEIVVSTSRKNEPVASFRQKQNDQKYYGLNGHEAAAVYKSQERTPVLAPQSEFVPKPYNLSPKNTINRATKPREYPPTTRTHNSLIELFSDNDKVILSTRRKSNVDSDQAKALAEPASLKLLPAPKLQNSASNDPVSNEKSEVVAEIPRRSPSPPAKRPSSRSRFFLHFKKSKDMKDHPTYGRYDLVRQAIKDILPQKDFDDGSLAPIIFRFTWHCCATFDRRDGTGGSSGGTLRFAQEFNENGNTGLNTAKSYLDQIHEEFPWISFADLYTLGGVVAIEALGGPVIPWKPGRTDCADAKKVPPGGRLPVATEGSEHLHEVFQVRLGLSVPETVALIGGGHGVGRTHPKFSGFIGPWTREILKFDNEFFKNLLEHEFHIWTVPQTGIEQYMSENNEFMMLPIDMELKNNPEFRKWTETFALDQSLFFNYFTNAFAKLLENGVIRDEDGVQRTKI
ncbi:unnamed protein product [Ambrosiozyma monospora]|uniref:Unnamed protein product n=1 Tax=Ambrosiozyma monospora TaxID=43982 RepID=A0ACB5T3T0_AMBMO|nr:unnamed protein product [Ambrosiozyma monospora]